MTTLPASRTRGNETPCSCAFSHLHVVSQPCGGPIEMMGNVRYAPSPKTAAPPPPSVSEGVRIDELHFDTECKVVEAWCNRQMFEVGGVGRRGAAALAAWGRGGQASDTW